MEFVPERKRWAPALVFIAALIGLAVYEVATEREQPARSSERRVTADSFSTWPFNVPSGVLRCRSGRLVTFESGGTEYALNGTAASSGYPEVDPIWLDSPDSTGGPKVSIREVLDSGLTLC